MDASSVLWLNWQEQIQELLPGIHGHQKKTLAFFVLGIVLSGCAVMQRVAETLSERHPTPLRRDVLPRVQCPDPVAPCRRWQQPAGEQIGRHHPDARYGAGSESSHASNSFRGSVARPTHVVTCPRLNALCRQSIPP